MYSDDSTKEAEYLKKIFGEYYATHKVDLSFVEKREFGFGIFKRKIANRNMAFRSVEEMNQFLKEKKPLFFSYSNAYYKYPDRKPMEAKEILGADIIYEFDADELGLEVPEINGYQWFEQKHLEEAKKQIFYLIDFLEKDFGFDSNEFRINFSGKAGYHLHIRSENIRPLKRQARIELVDYITGSGIFFEKLGYDFDNGVCSLVNSGWPKRLNKKVKEFLLLDAKELSKITGVEKKKISDMLKSRDEVLSKFDKGVLFKLDGKKSADFWKSLFTLAVEKTNSPIDRQTSIDLNKIIRVPNTLHGDTGFLAKELTVKELKDFDPFSDSIVFKSGEQKIFVKSAPKFTLLKKEFGPFENVEVTLPTFAAVYLLGKGAELR